MEASEHGFKSWDVCWSSSMSGKRKVSWQQIDVANDLICCLRGFAFSFGLFQNYYEAVLLPNSSPSNISWIGTVSSYLLIVTGVISGPLFDLGHYQIMLFGGAAVSCFGTFMLSLSTEYYQILLSQGICVGLGCGVLYIPGLALVGRSFTTRRAIALGLVSCGAPVG